MFREKVTFLLLLGLGLYGCSTIDSRISGRTATEQYLVTAAVRRAVDSVRWKSLRGNRVFIEIVGVQSTEYDFIRSVLEQRLIRNGAIPVDSTGEATVKLVAQVDAVGTDIWLSNFGIPVYFAYSSPSVPTNLNGVSLYNSNRQEGYCRMRFYGISPDSTKMVWKSGPLYGNSYFKTQTFLGFFGPYKSGDIFPERMFMFRPKGYKELRERELNEEDGTEPVKEIADEDSS